MHIQWITVANAGGIIYTKRVLSPPRLFLYSDMKCETAWADTHTDKNAAQLSELKIICIWERLAEKKLFFCLSTGFGFWTKSSVFVQHRFYFGLKPLRCTPAAVGNERGHSGGSTWTFPTRLTVLPHLVRQKPALQRSPRSPTSALNTPKILKPRWGNRILR